jgi:uncharacterized protein YdeI (BOF family)
MKRLVLILIVVLAAGTMLAGEGKSCDVNKNTKSVELTGTLAWEGDNTVFHVANSSQTYTVCHKTAAKFTKLAKDGGTVAIKGKLVSCDEAEGQELVIESAKKV